MRRSLAGVVVFVAATAAAFVLPSSASAAGTASVQGTVTTSGAAPVAGVSVKVFSAVYGTLLGQSSTDGAGHYLVAGLPAGKVRVQFVAAGYPSQWNGGAPSFKSAADITTVAGTTITGDHVLRHTGSIDATITTANGTPLAGMVAVASPADIGEVLTGASSSASGQLSLPLAPFSYKVLVYDPAISSGSGYLPQFDSGSVFATIPGIDAAFAAATPVVVPESTAVAKTFLLTPSNCTPSLYFPGANLAGVALAGTNLAGCNLAGANLMNANLTNANLAGARLTGADLRGTTIAGVSWTGSICPDGTAADAHSSTCAGHLGLSTTLTVDSALDQPDLVPGDGLCWSSAGACTLRAAIQEANAGAADTVTLSPITYTLTIAGRGEDAGATGDLDVTADLTIHGNGATIDANHLDRVLQVLPGVSLSIDDVTLTGGTTASGSAGADVSGFSGGNGGPGGAGEDGGGILNAGTLVMTNAAVAANTTGSGGHGGMGGGEGYLDGNPVHAGSGGNGGNGGRGGGIFNTGSLTLAAVTVSGNTTGAGGAGGMGGIVAISMPSDWWSIGGIGGNGGTGGHGGGIFSTGAVSVTNTTIGANTTGAGGAAGQGGPGKSAWISICEPGFSCWYAQDGYPGTAGKGGSGAGIFVAAGPTTLTTATVAQNHVATGGSGGGIAVLFGSATARSSILENPGVGLDCKGPVSSGGFNLEATTSCKFVATGDRQSATASLGPLANNGGATLTYLPGAGSVVVDAIPVATNGCGTTLVSDQRGVSRPQGPACDIGAVER